MHSLRGTTCVPLTRRMPTLRACSAGEPPSTQVGTTSLVRHLTPQRGQFSEAVQFQRIPPLWQRRHLGCPVTGYSDAYVVPTCSWRITLEPAPSPFCRSPIRETQLLLGSAESVRAIRSCLHKRERIEDWDKYPPANKIHVMQPPNRNSEEGKLIDKVDND